MEEKNCAFQYATKTTGFFGIIDIIEDQTEITLSEAKELWDKHYPGLRTLIQRGTHTGEMVIWVNMTDKYSFREKLHHISNDAEVEGDYIIERSVTYFPKKLS